MYYEVYIDVLFLQNVFMDCLVLMTINRITKGNASFGRNFSGGVLGATLTCVLIAVPMPGAIRTFLFHTAINTAMLTAGLRIRNKYQFIKAIALLYAVSILYGGIFYLFYPYIRRASLFFAAAVGSYFIIRWIWNIVSRQRQIQRRVCAVSLYTKKGEKKIKALIDTGNMLKDTLTGKPVSLIGLNTAKCIFDEKEMSEGFRLVPYRTVGKQGVLPVFCIQKLYIHQKGRQIIEKPLIGVTENKISDQEEYEMILNPELIGGIKDVC